MADLLTAEQYALLSKPEDGTRDELHRGNVVQWPLPGGRHGYCVGRTARILDDHCELHSFPGHLCVGSGIIVERGPDTVLAPAVSMWTKTKLAELSHRYPEIPPDLLVEVMDGYGETEEQVAFKIDAYLRFRVPLVWFVYPEDRSVHVYRSLPKRLILGENDTLTGDPVLPGFSCLVRELFP
jgi:Uma2 family endonuclease